MFQSANIIRKLVVILAVFAAAGCAQQASQPLHSAAATGP